MYLKENQKKAIQEKISATCLTERGLIFLIYEDYMKVNKVITIGWACDTHISKLLLSHIVCGSVFFGRVKWSQHQPHSLCWIPQQVCPMPSPGHHFVGTVACHSGGYPWGWIVFFNSTWALQLVFALRAKKSAWASLFSLLFSLSASKAEGDKP